MAHHKRRRPKSQRAGCLLCKPYKANWMKDSRHALKPRDRRERERLDAQEADARLDEVDVRSDGGRGEDG